MKLAKTSGLLALGTRQRLVNGGGVVNCSG
jgi:hypothetical protein